MATYQIFKETALPGTLVANGIYLITHPTNSAYLEVYVSDNSGTATRRIPTESDIQSLINAAVSGLSGLEVVATIAARNALSPSENVQVLVLDATADGTVASGAATYIWDNANTSWEKISEAESLDVSLAWSSIVGGPSSTPTQIDAAVTASHTHSNKTQLDKVGENGNGQLTYDGDEYVVSGTTAW